MRRLDLNKMLEDRKALERASVLEKRVQDLLLENENLKRSYKLIEDISDKKKIENKIVDNQDSFKKSMLSTIGYRDGKWSYEIDPNTLYYDKTAHTVYYELIGYDNDGKKVDIRKRKIFIDTNSSMRLGTVIFYRDGRTSELRTGISKGAEIICPDEEVEYAQKKIYKYLGIQSTSVNKPTQWVYVTRWGNVFDMYYDKSNMKIDRTKGVVSLFVKDHSTDENFNAIYQVIVHINDYYFEEYNINKAGYERIESNSITQGKLFWAIRNLYYS